MVREWETDFHERYAPFFANYLWGNASTMILLKNCYQVEPNEDFGMDLINGMIDIDTYDKIENHSSRQTIFAIGSNFDSDEPLAIVRDDRMADGIAILKYIPGGGGEEEDDAIKDVPIEVEKKRRKII